MGDNVATVKAIYEAFGKGDIPAVLGTLADDVRWEDWRDNTAQSAGVPWMQFRAGGAAVTGFFEIIGSWQMTGFRVLSIMDGGRQVAAEIELDALIGGRELHEQEMHLWTFDEAGKVSRFRHYLDTAKHIALSNSE